MPIFEWKENYTVFVHVSLNSVPHPAFQKRVEPVQLMPWRLCQKLKHMFGFIIIMSIVVMLMWHCSALSSRKS